MLKNLIIELIQVYLYRSIGLAMIKLKNNVI